MLRRDYRDIAGGAVLMAVGIGFAWYAVQSYNVGSLRRMGPGAFPAGLGVILAVLGLLQAVPAFFRAGVMPEIRVWSPIFVLAGLAGFALVIRPFGLVPAVFAVILVSSLADLRIRPVSIGALATGMALLTWLVFGVGLGMSVPMFRWPL